MKRVKLVLVAIGILTILGGIFAFKAKKLAISYCRLRSPGVCTITYLNTSFEITTTGNLYCTFEHGDQCLQKAVTFVQP